MTPPRLAGLLLVFAVVALLAVLATAAAGPVEAQPSEPVIRISGPRSVTEGGTLHFTVSSSHYHASLTVNLRVTSDIDSDGVTRVGSDDTVVFNNGTTATYSVETVDDAKDERNNYVKVEVVDAEGYRPHSVDNYVETIIHDNDQRGVDVSETMLRVSEAGSTNTTTYTVTLSSEPWGDDNTVTVTPELSNTAAATVMPATLTFTAENWDTSQEVTVTGTDDNNYDPGEITTISHLVAGADYGDHYGSRSAADVQVTVNNNDDDIAPTATAAPTFSELTETSFRIHWTAPTYGGSPPISYDLRYKLQGASDDTYRTRYDITNTTYVLDRRSSGATYEVQIEARNTVGRGPWSPSGIVTTLDQRPVLSEGLKTVRSLVVEWAAPTSQAATVTGYDVRYRQQGASAWTDGPQNTLARDAQFDDLTAGATYEFQVRAKRGAADGGWSGSLAVTMDSMTPGGVIWRSVMTVGRYIFTPPTTGFRATGPTVGSLSPSVIGFRTGHVDITLVEATLILDGHGQDTFEVHGNFGGGATRTANSTYTLYTDGSGAVWGSFPGTAFLNHPNLSSWRTVGTRVKLRLVEALRPLAPTGVAATTEATAAGRIEVRWDAPDNTGRPAITGYAVRYRLAGSSDDWTEVSRGAGETSVVLSGLTAGAEYEAQARARNIDGDGLWSELATGRASNGFESIDGHIWSATMTVGVQNVLDGDGNLDFTRRGYITDGFRGSLSSTGFTYRGAGYTVKELYDKDGPEFALSAALSEKLALVFSSGGDTRVVRFGGATRNSGNVRWWAVFPNNVPALPQWAAGAQVIVALIEAPTLSVEVVGPSSINEGGTARFRVTASRAPLADLPVTLNIAATGDHGVTTGTQDLEIAAGQTSVSYDAPTSNDGMDEPNGTITATLGDSVGYHIAGEGRNAAQVEVRDDDTLSFLVWSATLNPGISSIGGSIDYTGYRGTGSTFGSLNPTTFTFRGQSYQVSRLAERHEGGSRDIRFDLNRGLGGGTFVLTVSFSSATFPGGSSGTHVLDGSISSNSGQSVTLRQLQAAPTFNDGDSTSRSIDENLGAETSGGVAVGSPISASDVNPTQTLTYSLGGTDGASFTINAANGQISTKAGVNYDHETKSSYSVVVTVIDGSGAGDDRDSIAVTINVNDQNEPPLPPDAPSVAEVVGQSDRVTVSWTEPENTGRPAITGYRLQYKPTTGPSDWMDWTRSGSDLDLTETVTGLMNGVDYSFRVKAVNADGESATWSNVGTGMPWLLITVSIQAVETHVAEGAMPVQSVGFRLTADPPPRSTLAVQVEISASGGDYGIPAGRVTVQIDTSGTGTYSGTISDDSVEDDAGSVTATLVDGAAYDLAEDMDDHTATVSITDASDTRGVTVTAADLITVVESGAGNSTTYRIRLNTEPTGDVTITPSSSDETVATVSGALTFTSSNWQTDQVVTVTGVDDDVDNSDSPRGARITHMVEGGDYGLNNVEAAPVDVEVTNDGDTRGVTIVADDPIVIAENGGEATFTVVLDSEPTGDVAIALGPVGSAISISEDSPLILTFTPENWNTAQEVTVTGVDDDIDNAGDKRNASILGVAGMGGYNGVTVPIVRVEVTDDDDPGLVVSRDAVSVDEDGGTATYTIKLSSEPTADVTVTPAVSSGDTAAAAVSGALTFTPDNWDTAQEVTVTGQNDDIDNPGDQRSATITHSAAGGGYNLSGAASVAVTVIDDEVPVISIEPVSDSVAEGSPVQFRLTAAPAPAAPLTVNLDLAYTAGYVTAFSEGRKTRDIPTSGSVTFDIPTVGDDVDRADGTVTATLADGTGYDLGSSTTASVTVSDDNTRGIRVHPLAQTVTESSGASHSASYTVRLDSRPTATVTITPMSSDTSVATVSGALTFTPEAWSSSQTQTVVVTGVDDNIDNVSDRTATVSHEVVGGDYGSNNVSAANVVVTVTDDDTVGISVSGVSGNALTVDENGNTGNGTAATYHIKLDSQPTGTVTIALSSDATGNATVSPATLTFDASNWNTNKQVTVTAVNDAIDNEVGGNDYRSATISHEVSGADYGSATISDIAVRVNDDDTRGVTVSETARTVAEDGGTATYTIRLNSEPTVPVIVSLEISGDSDSITPTMPDSVIFYPSNWSVEQTITITGRNDDVDNSDADGSNNHRVATITHSVISLVQGTGDYIGVTAGSVAVTVTDDDTRGVIVSETALTVSEDGTTATYTVRLTSEPAAQVTIRPDVDAAIATVSPSPLTFDSTNWGNRQTVTVTGVEDQVDNLNNQRAATISHGVTGGDYGSVTPAGVTVTVTDNDTAGVEVSESELTVSEDGTTTTASYTISLATRPRAGQNVVVNVAPSGPISTNSGGSLTFTEGNWNTPQTVTVSGVNDNIDNENNQRTGSIAHTIDASSSPEYARLTPAGVDVTVTDDDTREVRISETTREVSENGGTATYTVVLGAQPTEAVTITLGTSGETGAISLSATTLTFQPTGSTGLWSAPQTVTVTGVNDGIDNRGNRRNASISHTAQGGDYTGETARPVSVTVTDDDVPQVAVVVSSSPVTEGNSAGFQVSASPAPWQSLSVGLSVAVIDDGNPAATRTESVTIAAYDAPTSDGTTVTHTVRTTDDALHEPAGSITATLTASSTDAGYELGSPTSATVTVNDNDNDGPTWGRGLTVAPQTVREDAGQVAVAVTATGLTTDDFTCWANMTAAGTTAMAADFSGLGTSFEMGTTFDFKTTTTQTVSVTTVNDAVDEDTEALVINCKLANNTGGTAAGTLTINDDDTRGIRLSTTSVQVTEDDGDANTPVTAKETATYTVVLTSQPSSGTVIVTPTSSDTDVATVSGALTFTTSNWNTAQTVTVRSPQDENASHEDATITHSVSAAGNDYAGQSVPAVRVRVIDNDVMGYLAPSDESLSYNQPFWLSLPWLDDIDATTTQDQMRGYRENMWGQLQLPGDIETRYPGINAHDAVLCWEEVGTSHTWVKGGVVISGPNASWFISKFQLRAPAVRHDTTLVFKLTVRPSESWLADRECNGGLDMIEVEVHVKASTVGFADAVGTIPPVLLQSGDSRYFDVAPYFGPAPGALRYEVVSVTPAEAASATLRGANATGLSETDVIVKALAEGEATVTIRASVDERYGGASATQTFRVIAGDKATYPVQYRPDPGVSYTIVDLNDLVPSGVFGPGSALSWEQVSGHGPTVELTQNAYGASFKLPDLEHGTKLLFRITGKDALGAATTFRQLLLVFNPTGAGWSAQQPWAAAGDDVYAGVGEFVTLDGARSTSPTGNWWDLSLWWRVKHAPERLMSELQSSIAASREKTQHLARFVMPQLNEGEYLEFHMSARIWWLTGSDTVRVHHKDTRLRANAGPDQEAHPGDVITLRGSSSRDSQAPVRYGWVQLSESTVPLRDANTANPSFVMPERALAGSIFQFGMTATGQDGQSDSDTVTVTAAGPTGPTACAGPDLTGAAGTEVTLQGRCSTNPYGKWYQMAHSWTQLSGPTVTLSDATVGDPTFTIPAVAADGTTFGFELTVTDQEGESDSDTMVVTVGVAQDIQPTACAGPDLVGAPGDEVTLQGTCSANPYGEWWRLAHAWTQLSGPSVTLTHPNTSQPASNFGDPAFTIPADAVRGTTLEFELTVTDKESQSDSDTMIVTVTGAEPENTLPTAAIDAAQVAAAAAGDTVVLQGVGNDAETAPESLIFAWSQVGGTPTVSIVNAGAATASFTAPDVTEQTSLTFRLTVTDEGGLSADAGTTITVSPPPEPENAPPTFDEDTAATRSLAENSAAGVNVGAPITATDPDGDTLTYTVSGSDAGLFSINAGTGQVTTVAGATYDYETQAAYSLTVEASDGNGGTASILVTVNLTNVNEAPAFDDGSSTTRQVAENSAAGVNVGAPITAIDPDGDALTYSLSGSDAGSFSINDGTGQLQTKAGVSYDYETQPSYSLAVTADDPSGATVSILVTVNLTDVDETPPDTAPTVSETSQFKNHAATVGQAFSVVLPTADEGSGNGGPYEYLLWKRSAGVHFGENGLSFNATTREVSGTPSEAGTFLLAYQVHDADDNRSRADSFVAETNLQITVAPAPDTAPTVSDTSQLKNHEATVGQAFSVVLPAADEGSGNGAPYEYLLWHQGQGRNFMDQAINGLRFDAATRTLSGTPEEAGVWQMSYVIHDADENRSVEDRFREREKLRVTVSE